MKKVYQSVATDIVVFTIENDKLKILLIKREKEPFKDLWALPGGFLLENEPPEEAALRVLKEKAGISKIYIEQLYTFPGSGRDPRGNVITITYFALAPAEKIQIKKAEKTQNPTLYSFRKLPKLAFDHKKIIDYAKKRLNAKLEYTNVIYSLLPPNFTLNQLQKTYEMILNRKLDKRNFQKKFTQLELLKNTRRVYKGNRQRPAKLYSFASNKLSELKKFF